MLGHQKGGNHASHTATRIHQPVYCPDGLCRLPLPLRQLQQTASFPSSAPDGKVSTVMSIIVRRLSNEAKAVIREGACRGIGNQCGLGIPSVSDGRNSRGANRSHHPVRSGAGPSGDGEEDESEAQQSVYEGQIGTRSRHVIEYGGTKEVWYLMKGQVYWRGVSVRSDS